MGFGGDPLSRRGGPRQPRLQYCVNSALCKDSGLVLVRCSLSKISVNYW